VVVCEALSEIVHKQALFFIRQALSNGVAERLEIPRSIGMTMALDKRLAKSGNQVADGVSHGELLCRVSSCFVYGLFAK